VTKEVDTIDELIEAHDGPVIDDDAKFAISLGFKSSDELFTSAVFGALAAVAVGVSVTGLLTVGAAATAAAATAAAVAGMGFWQTIAVSLGLAAAPVIAPAAIPILIPILTGLGAGGAAGALFYFIKTKGKKFSTYGGYKSFNTNIERLGVTIAGIIFLPIAGVVRSNNQDYSFIKEEMEKWGYARQYIDHFIAHITKMTDANFKKALLRFDAWFKSEMKKPKYKVSKKDIEMKKLNAIKMDIAKRYFREIGRPFDDKIFG
jgi:hypothetical protein